MKNTEDNNPITEHAIETIKSVIGKKLIVDQPLAEYNTFGTGGNARLFVNVDSSEELVKVVKIAEDMKIPFFMLGGGSNVLVADSGYEGLVIKNCIKGLKTDGNSVIAGAGEELQDLIDFTAGNGISGLEFASGIYGTVGGAIFGNAGAYGSDVGTYVESVELVDRQGNIRNEPGGYFEFGYRYSKLKRTREFAARAKFALKSGNKDQIRARIDEILAMRKEKLPENAKTAGCFFKNIPDPGEEHGKMAAGKLLDEIGAKEMTHGGARVFEKHANIILNDGTADSTEIVALSRKLKAKVKNKFGIELEEEITFLGKV